MQEFEFMNNSREQHESYESEERTMQIDKEQQRFSLQEQNTFTQKRVMQEQQQRKLMSDASTLKKQD